tara:strand:+ start:107 stop:829 length:723 start_codon:yes stop_codon:yes gene_type:complete
MGLPREKLPVLEQFVSIQGEGKNLGTPYVFVRVGGCPLRCRFCDSEYTWTLKKDSIMSTEAVAKLALSQAEAHSIDWISVTGGEPLMYPEQMKMLMQHWWDKGGIKTHIETSGRFYDAEVHNMCDLWSMDIKTPCTNEVNEKDLDHLRFMRSGDQVKCLIEGDADLEYARRVHILLDGRCTMVLQPFNVNVDDTGTDKSLVLLEQYNWLVKKVLGAGMVWSNTIITPQVHVLAFGNTPAT